MRVSFQVRLITMKKELKLGIVLLFVFLFSIPSLAQEPRPARKTHLDFEGASIEGEIRSPGEFYFQRKSEDKMNSLVKRRKNFHRQILRDVVLSK